MEAVNRLRELNDPRVEAWLQDKKAQLDEILATKTAEKYKKATETRAIELIQKFRFPVTGKMLDQAIAADYEDFILEAAKLNLIFPTLETAAKPSAKVVEKPKRESQSEINIVPSLPRSADKPFKAAPVEIIQKKPDYLEEFLLAGIKYPVVDLEKPTSNIIFRWSFHPILEKLPAKETGLEQKIGGHVPFFKEGDKWPLDEVGVPMAFFAQFVDPRESGTLTQIWIGNVDTDDVYPEVKVKKYRADKFKAGKQDIIPEPANVPNKNHILNPGIITVWKLINEVNPVYLREQNESMHPKDWDELYDKLEKDGLVFGNFKIGGFGDTGQGETYTDLYQNIYYQKWGDMGTLHLASDLKTLEGDMG
jgi:hypothetical protein